ncbi:hypothetical protein ACT18_23620 [Mycolicibacter kumamotonensis]|uniref:Uncharacterized protein n=1 Tax=Mycolicibacter kumamotonensis TaxID=354243 RepID=A0A1B8S9I1_9MYCO|nr:hypothetical protein ACT18_23620 [Mycolicibacter kumamotonensis]
MDIHHLVPGRVARQARRLLHVSERYYVGGYASDQETMSSVAQRRKSVADIFEYLPVLYGDSDISVVGAPQRWAVPQSPIQQVPALRTDDHYLFGGNNSRQGVGYWFDFREEVVITFRPVFSRSLLIS